MENEKGYIEKDTVYEILDILKVSPHLLESQKTFERDMKEKGYPYESLLKLLTNIKLIDDDIHRILSLKLANEDDYYRLKKLKKYLYEKYHNKNNRFGQIVKKIIG